jgi:hypothetical protein
MESVTEYWIWRAQIVGFFSGSTLVAVDVEKAYRERIGIVK